MEGESEHICGIDPIFIENRKNYESLINDMKCPMCLKVILEPLECKLCQVLLCENCHFILTLAEQKCVNPKCEGKYEKANKFIREILCALKITCRYCKKTGMNYTDYLKHIDHCQEYLKNPILALIQDINKKNDKIEQLNKDINEIKKRNEVFYTPDEIRKKFVTFSLDVNSKMEIYNSCVEGNVQKFKNLIEVKGYPILEEISARNFGWTSFHYAMHYGKWNIIQYIMTTLQTKGFLNMALQIKSSDGRCPLLCLLRSNVLDPDTKKKIFDKIIKEFKNIFISQEVKDELKKRTMLYLLDGL